MTDGKIAIGIIRTSFGLKGEVKVKSFSGETEHFLNLPVVHLKVSEVRFLYFKVEEVKEYKGSIILKLEGIDTPEQGKRLAGKEIWVERQYAAPREEDEYYHADLCGCTVFLAARKIGRIKAVVEGHIYELLEVSLETGGTCLVPFTEMYVGIVDIENKQVFLTEEAKQL